MEEAGVPLLECGEEALIDTVLFARLILVARNFLHRAAIARALIHFVCESC